MNATLSYGYDTATVQQTFIIMGFINQQQLKIVQYSSLIIEGSNKQDAPLSKMRVFL